MDLEVHTVGHSPESQLLPKLLSIPLKPKMPFEFCSSAIFSGRGGRLIFWIRRARQLGGFPTCIPANRLEKATWNGCYQRTF